MRQQCACIYQTLVAVKSRSRRFLSSKILHRVPKFAHQVAQASSECTASPRRTHRTFQSDLKSKKRAKKESSSDRIELSTSRLTVGRANRLRHEDMLNVRMSFKLVYSHLNLSAKSRRNRSKFWWVESARNAKCALTTQICTVPTLPLR